MKPFFVPCSKSELPEVVGYLHRLGCRESFTPKAMAWDDDFDGVMLHYNNRYNVSKSMFHIAHDFLTMSELRAKVAEWEKELETSSYE